MRTLESRSVKRKHFMRLKRGPITDLIFTTFFLILTFFITVSLSLFLQLYELNDDPKRKEFLDDIFNFMQKRGKWGIGEFIFCLFFIVEPYQLI